MDQETQDKRFQEWLKTHKGILIKIARSFSNVQEDFDDLFQEILLQVWKSIPSFNEKSNNATWIYRVALNRALVWKRREGKRHDLLRILNSDMSLFGEVSEPKDNRIDELYLAIRKLPKSERALILLMLEGLSYREISEIVEITETNVGARLNRTKKKLTQLVNGGEL